MPKPPLKRKGNAGSRALTLQHVCEVQVAIKRKDEPSLVRASLVLWQGRRADKRAVFNLFLC